MASFSEIYFNIGSFSAKAQGFFSGGKFLLDPELRAQRIVNISQHADIGFCKAFWFLTESGKFHFNYINYSKAIKKKKKSTVVKKNFFLKSL